MNAENKTKLRARVQEPVHFVFYRDGGLHYKTFDDYVFEVPISDTTNAQGGDPTFSHVEKGITLMRWIRRAMEQEERWWAEHDANGNRV